MFHCKFSTCEHVFENVIQFFQHIKLHSNAPNYHYQCGVPDCTQMYRKATVLKTQMYRDHKEPDVKRKGAFKKSFNYVEPVPLFLGNYENGTELFAKYVPVQETLAALFKSESVREQYAATRLEPSTVNLYQDRYIYGEPHLCGTTRTAQSYQSHLQDLKISDTNSVCGIKSDSPFNQLGHFHVCQPGLPPCLGHDMFEGIVSYDLALLSVI
ncbi:hypothetical protein F7725_020856 [Dissostichus mawsoni]|uniref:C2H2-type domain-containing protein n=1 Tax=Dissostichus mawsoni TaxID=36200 RepID=A0A7J5YHS6_DISMA|nr:hypothetical protein F7725_007504 [Dissostichus mawsoni]KAF3847828.1 hypothetical protein F7725_020856 [Dissostichus mawsoni]